jgi:HD-GYP domain-containing protein (c-di-GMP phosphodiesterase class II)
MTEALDRIEEAAGTQLDPYLVQMFVRGMREMGDAPLPDRHGQVDTTTRLSIPGSQVA